MIKIANGQAFWGDRQAAPARLVEMVPDLDYLTLDYLAEVSMSILATQKEKNSDHGYARDFLEVVKAVSGSVGRVKLITNAGGLNVHGLAHACADLLPPEVTIAAVDGDQVLTHLLEGGAFPNSETGEEIDKIKERLVTANAYLGAQGIVEALGQGADLVVTGRVADPSMAVAAACHSFGWKSDDYDKIASATVAGHLIECGTQVTGGFSTNWLEVPGKADMGYPYVEMEDDGTFVITKPEGTGGTLNQETVKEQLLYEIGDPGSYLSPDATVSFLSLQLEERGKNRLQISHVKGKAPPPTYKVGAIYRDGYRAEATLALVGRDAKIKAKASAELLFERVGAEGHFETLGSDSECLLYLAIKNADRAVVDRFSKELAPLITSGPQGLTGYLGGRPKVRDLFAFWPTLIDRSQAMATVTLIQGRALQ